MNIYDPLRAKDGETKEQTDDRQKAESEVKGDAFRDGLADLVRRSLVELGDMANIQDGLRAVSNRMSKFTPPPSASPGDSK